MQSYNHASTLLKKASRIWNLAPDFKKLNADACIVVGMGGGARLIGKRNIDVIPHGKNAF